MSTNAIANNDRIVSTAPEKFYVPGAPGASYESGRVERFLTNLYARHRLLTRRLD